MRGLGSPPWRRTSRPPPPRSPSGPTRSSSSCSWRFFPRSLRLIDRISDRAQLTLLHLIELDPLDVLAPRRLGNRLVGVDQPVQLADVDRRALAQEIVLF